MRFTKRAVLLIAIVASFCSYLSYSQAEADTVIVNAKIYTVNPHQQRAEALAIRGNKIVAIGSEKEIAPFRGEHTKVINARQHLLLPGFTDCHIHFMDGSLGLTEVDLNGAGSIVEIQKRVKAYADAHSQQQWILGMGWTYPTFSPSGLPDKKILDDVVPDRPVFLSAFDGHSSWANSKALELAGVTRETPNPPNGTIVRDEKGDATGALKEAAADLVNKVVPKPTRDERLDALRKGIREANRVGLTRVHSAGGDFQFLDLLDELRKKNELNLRFYVAYFLDPPELTTQAMDKIEQARRAYKDDWISGGAVKTMLDGVVEAHTAAMLSPYSDDPSQSGKLFWDPEKYKQAVMTLDKNGLQVFTHAIGDKAVRLSLDAYEQAAKTNHSKDARHRVEHIETITARDIPRFGKLKVIASFQPLHAYPDDDTMKVWARNAGSDRASRGFAWRSVESKGGVLAFGSDWPVVTLNPWSGVQNAVTRQTTEGVPAGGWLPSERLTIAEAIEGYTLGAARGGRRERTEGSLEVGKLADMILVSQDLFSINPMDISKTEVLFTMVGGRIVYPSSGFTDGSSAGGR